MVQNKKTVGKSKKELISPKSKTKAKKGPGRPKKEFVSQKPTTKSKKGPGRPRKNVKENIAPIERISPEITSFVAKSVDDSKKKDLIILGLFLFSFVLFVVSLYYTFIKDKTPTEELGQITNIETGNIDYNLPTTIEEPEINMYIENSETEELIAPIIQSLTEAQQVIVDFYQALNAVDMDTIYVLTDTHLKSSNVFKTYYSRRWLTNFTDALIAPKVVVTNIQEIPTSSSNPDIKSFEYTLEYMMISNQQKFTEERSTTLLKKGDTRKIGKLMCELQGCSRMPFFNTEKYK